MKDYKDVDLKFGMHPVTKDVTMKSGKWAVLQSVRNIVMSSAGEWRTLPDMGAGKQKNHTGCRNPVQEQGEGVVALSRYRLRYFGHKRTPSVC